MAVKTEIFTTRQKMMGNTFEIFHYRDETLKEVALHSHDFYEVYFFISGNVSYNVGSHNYRLTAGDVLVIGPGEQHQPVFAQEQQNYERFVLWIHKNYLNVFNIQGQELDRCFDTELPGHTDLLHPDGTTRELLHYQMQILYQEQHSNEYASEMYAMGCLAQILTILNRLALVAAKEPEQRANADRVVYRVWDYINNHYNEDISLVFLANRFFVSKYHLSREFNRIVGTSVHRYIVGKRLAMAKQMLHGGMPISTVYQYCGFGDYSNFYRAFKAEYHVSPKAFVQSLREK